MHAKNSGNSPHTTQAVANFLRDSPLPPNQFATRSHSANMSSSPRNSWDEDEGYWYSSSFRTTRDPDWWATSYPEGVTLGFREEPAPTSFARYKGYFYVVILPVVVITFIAYRRCLAGSRSPPEPRPGARRLLVPAAGRPRVTIVAMPSVVQGAGGLDLQHHPPPPPAYSESQTAACGAGGGTAAAAEAVAVDGPPSYDDAVRGPVEERQPPPPEDECANHI